MKNFTLSKFAAAAVLLSAFASVADAQATVHGHFNVKWTPSNAPATNGTAILQGLIKPHPQPPPHPVSVGTPMDCNVLSQYGLVFPGVYTNIFPLPPTCAPILSGLNGISGTVVSGIGTVDMSTFWTFVWSNDAITTVNGTLEFSQGCINDTSVVQFWTFTGYDATGDPAYYIASKVWDRFGGLVLEGSITFTADKQPVFYENPPDGITEVCGSPGGENPGGDGGDGGDAKPIKPMLVAPPALVPRS